MKDSLATRRGWGCSFILFYMYSFERYDSLHKGGITPVQVIPGCNNNRHLLFGSIENQKSFLFVNKEAFEQIMGKKGFFIRFATSILRNWQ